MATRLLEGSLKDGGGSNNYGTLLGTGPGLTSEKAKQLLLANGPNELEAAPKDSFLKILVTQMCNLIFLLTAIASILSFAMGDHPKGYFLIVLVVVVCFINTLGEYSGQDAGSALRKLDAQEAQVYRDGVLRTDVPVADLVDGDIVEVSAGMIVPADVELIECNDLTVNESLLTGEPKEVSKSSEVEDREAIIKSNTIYKSTSVATGTARGIVVATGMKTQVGLIAKRLKNPEMDNTKKNVGKDLNPLQVSINRLGTIIAAICGIVIVFVSVVTFAKGYQNVPPACSQDDSKCLFYSAVEQGLLLGIGIIPHGLPLVVMVMLRIGSKLMYERNALVMKQSAVDVLGATHVICTDKTGTLTAGVMAAKVFTGILKTSPSSQKWFSNAQPAPIKDVSASFYPLEGLNPKGGIFRSEELSEKYEKLLDHGASSETLGLVNLGNPKSKVSGDSEATALITHTGLMAAFIHCHKCSINPPAGDEKKWTAAGSTTEAALKVAAWKGGLIDGEEYGEALKEKYPREAAPELDVPFNNDRKMAASVLRLPENDRSFEGKLRFRPEHTHFAIVVGAPDRLFPFLGAFLSLDNGALIVDEVKPSTDELQRIKDTNANLGHKALRALLMAIRPLTASDMSALKENATSAEQRMKYLLSGPLAFHGLWGIYDPPRPKIEDSIRSAHEAFIRVVMVTGDQMSTAAAIGKKIGILSLYDDVSLKARECKDMHHKEPDTVRRKASTMSTARTYSVHDIKTAKDAHENEYIDDKDLNAMTQEVCVWSRAQPTDKVAIVDSLFNQELVVAMTGDGVNDAPALKRAAIGVSMGISGTAVTQQAADMILRDDNFSTIVAAVSEGRKIYVNVQKYVIYNLCVKGGECLVCTISVLANLPLPISGLPQLVNLVATHIIPPIALAWEDAESYTMKIPPRKTKGDLVVNRLLMLYRWLPFLVCYAVVICSSMCMNMYMNTGFFSVNALVGSTVPNAIADQKAACQLAGQFDEKGSYIADKTPFHCRCHETDQWGIYNTDDVVMDRLTGDTGDMFSQSNTPFKNGVDTLLEECVDQHGKARLCWKEPGGRKPLLHPANNCAAYGARKAETMSYVSIQTGEVLSLATFRTDGFVGAARFSMPYMCVLLLNFTTLLTVLRVPAIREALHFEPLQMHLFLIALVPAFILIVLNEMIKINFRARQRQKHLELGMRDDGNDKAMIADVFP
mmetsp:Transcript_14429/g.23666  ORF Transcript_14429/g.23666 Transcript_14429/m.23666 type:complete len:1201 (-) Transcript_14429:22-3624(-)